MLPIIASREEVSADLRRLAERYPAMSEPVTLYQRIEELQAGIAGALPAAPAISAPRRAALDEGQPLLRFDDLKLEEIAFEAWVEQMAEVLTLAGVDVEEAQPDRVMLSKAKHLAQRSARPFAASQGDSNDAVMLSEAKHLALARAGFAGRSGPADPPFASSLGALAAGQTLAGVLKGRAQALREAVDAGGWQRGYCPICGGWPDLGLISPENERRRLACARCDSIWPYRRVGCPFCGEDDQMRRFSSADNRFSLFWCSHCGAYLKHIRWPAEELPRSLTGLRLLTVGLDLDAQAQGWRHAPA